MINTNAVVMAVTLTVLICTVVAAQEVKYHESFEEGLPDYFAAARPASLSISPWHSKQGEVSLQWDWTAGEELVINRGIGDVERIGGYRCRASFAVWLYLEEPVEDALTFEFREGETVTGSFRFPLQFTGWKQGRLYYHDFPEGKPTSAVDNIRIVAPAEVEKGTVFVDFIKYNTLTYGGNSINPEAVARWQPPVPDEERFPRPEQVTEEQLEGIRKLLRPDEGTGIAQARVDELCERVEALGIVRDEHGVRGPGIDAHYQYLCAPGEHGLKDVSYMSDESGPDAFGVQDPRAMTSLANQVAVAYRASNDAGQRSRLAEAYLLLSDHLHDQVLQAASGFKWNWWVGGSWENSVFLMRDVLADNERLQGHLDFLLYTYGTGALFAEGAAPSHMDFFNMAVPSFFRQCLLQVEPEEQVRWLDAFKAMLEEALLQQSSAFKVDGSAFHHAAHYHSYAMGAFSSLANLMLDLSGTPWSFSTDAHERVRRAILAQQFYANKYDLPLSLTGRSPFAASYGVMRPSSVRAIRTLALCGTPDGTQEVDEEIAAAYLRLTPEAATEEPFQTLGIEPAADPNGTWVMPYAGLLCHRRDNWLAAVKGQNKYVWGSERQAQRNCYALFMGLGNLEILSAGDPVSAEANGRQHFGWDWRRFEGTTTPQLPLEMIDKEWTSVRSGETMMGGLAHRGRQGIFGMIVNQPMPGRTILLGRKSWFFDDDRIICLGSDISCDETEYPVQTTLCQKGLKADDEGEYPVTMLDGVELTACPEVHVLDASVPHWFTDVAQTAYWVPAGQLVTVARQNQTSRDLLDTEDTQGDFLTAWIDHGAAPSRANYEYVVVVRGTPEYMDSLAAEKPYEVMQCDEDAHIVRHRSDGRWSCVFFTGGDIELHGAGTDVLPVKAVDLPCLVVAEMDDEGRLVLSVADPDLNAEPASGDGIFSQPQVLHVTLRGAWQLLYAKGTVCAWDLEDAAENVRIVATNAEETVLEIVCQHGAGYELSLTR
ncbi:MAG: hypothetical protein GX358_11470 [candidate division WS1 bacterium]|nr:hypothetical protein [candidate division WS1 bacterium]